MSTTRTEITRLLEQVPEAELEAVKEFVNILLRKPERLTEAEIEEVDEGQREIQTGEWVRWEDVKRKDV